MDSEIASFFLSSDGGLAGVPSGFLNDFSLNNWGKNNPSNE